LKQNRFGLVIIAQETIEKHGQLVFTKCQDEFSQHDTAILFVAAAKMEHSLKSSLALLAYNIGVLYI
jgi:hypothetical protein